MRSGSRVQIFVSANHLHNTFTTFSSNSLYHVVAASSPTPPWFQQKQQFSLCQAIRSHLSTQTVFATWPAIPHLLHGKGDRLVRSFPKARLSPTHTQLDNAALHMQPD